MISRSESVADALRVDEAKLDDIRRARMERDLIAAWKQRATARFADHTGDRRRSSRRLPWAASVAVSGLIGGLVVLYGAQRNTEPTRNASLQAMPAAYFEVKIGDAATQTGALVEGQTLASGSHGEVQVHIGPTRIDLARESRLRFERITDKELRIALAAGQISVAYHPVVRGEQRLSIETVSASVLVVGTEFSVMVEPTGSTNVRVTEGIVRVMSRHGSDDRVLTAGDETRVEPQTLDLTAVQAPVDAEEAFAADLDFGQSPEAIDQSPEAIDVERLVAPTVITAAKHVTSAREHAAATHVDLEGDRMTPERRLDLARALLRQGHHDQARALLRVLTEAGQSVAYQAEAWTLTAESYTAQGYVPRAADSYRRAADVGRGTNAGHNAVFAWARLLERHTRDQQAAVLVYQRYLREAPQGALSMQATDALCRLGETTHCQ